MATGKGFSRASDTAEIRNYTSWGRTRGPKNIIDSNHKSPASVVLTGTEGLGGDTKTSVEYVTENQRFLHISHIGSDANTIQVQAYMHASGQWANIGSAISNTTTRTHTVLEIFGVDKVKFVVTALANTETCTIFPACSTF